MKTEQNYINKIALLKSGEEVIYEKINFGSWQQLQKLLYTNPEGFAFPTDEDMSTAKDALLELNDESGFVDELLMWKVMGKTLGTYLKGNLLRVDDNGYIHGALKLQGTKSGRLSSANPNLQNVPNPKKIKNPLARNVVERVKKSFIVPEGYTLIQFDYSQAELRLAAEFSNDPVMLKAYANDEDLHSLTAASTMGLTLEEFMALPPEKRSVYRGQGKPVNFGLIYRMGAAGLRDYARKSYGVRMTEEEAQTAWDSFFDLYKRILKYHDKQVEKGRAFGWVRTLFGRRRRLPDSKSANNFYRGLDERIAINSPIQGTAGEIMIFALAIIGHRLRHLRVIFVNTVHDSGLYYIHDDDLHLALPIIKQAAENLPMEQYFGRGLKKVTMKIDIEVSKESWKDLAEI
jgi:DNA polymerase-1